MGKVIAVLFYEVFLFLKMTPVLSLRDSAVEVFKRFKSLLTKLNFPRATLDLEVWRLGSKSDLLRIITVLKF